MISESIAISEYKEGDILACDAVNSNGVVLVVRGTSLNDYIINRLRANGIEQISVYHYLDRAENKKFDIEFKEKYISTVFETKRLFQELLNGGSIKHDDILAITENIYQYVSYSDDILKCLIKIRNSDEYTYNHSVNVAFYSMLLSNWMDLSGCQAEKAVQAGLLHDLGKTKIPYDILNKKGSLTREEFDVVKEHTILGYELVNRIEGLDQGIKTAVLLHHERMDGSGYPYRYKPEDKEFNIYSKIVAIADVFDAMTSDRVYKKKTTPFEVFEMFQTVGLSLFDTKMLKVFMEKLAVYLVGSKVLLSNGKQGKIVYIPLHNLTRPIIQASSSYIDLSQDSEIKIENMM